ncbi:MAG: restriction endonuclease subunit S [Actinomyces sp. oral taxon 181]|nr:restriction endonuclease subunit S [Actinomyces sp. oral taxon 181]
MNGGTKNEQSSRLRLTGLTLGDIASIVMGQSPKGEQVNKRGVGLPLLNGPTEFGSNHPSPVQWAQCWTKEACAGDILFCVRGSTTGRMNWADRTYAIGRGLAAISPSDPALSYLVRAVLQSAVAELLAGSTGSTFPNVSRRDLASIRLPDLGVSEAIRISRILQILDDKIESNQAVITRAEQLIDEIAVQRATDLPMVALSEVCSLSKSTWKPETSPDQTVQLFSLPAFDEGATPEQAAVASIKSNKTLMDRPGILVSRLNPRISRMWWVEIDAARVNVCSPEFAYLTAGDMHGLACTWLAVRSPEFRGEIVDRVTGTSGSHQRVRPADLMTIGVPDYRSLAEHLQATVLTLLHLVSDRRQQSVALAELRDALLPELMSGRMRVDEAGRLVSENLGEEVR